MTLPTGYKSGLYLELVLSMWRQLALLLTGRAMGIGMRFMSLQENDEDYAAIKRLYQLTKWERRWFFELMFPWSGKYVAAAFENYRYYQYSISFGRKSFRNPDQFEETLNAATLFVRQTFNIFRVPLPLSWYVKHAWCHKGKYGADLSRVIGIVVAQALTEDDQKIRELIDKAAHQKDAQMSAMVPIALIYSNSPNDDELIKDVIGKAGIFEGLRQIFFENLNESSIEKFERLVNMAKTEKWARFSSLVRAIDVWFGLGFVAQRQTTANDILNKTKELLSGKVIKEESFLDRHLRLWTIAFGNVAMAVAEAKKMIMDEKWEIRYLAAHFLIHVETPTATECLEKLLDDPDRRVSTIAFLGLVNYLDGLVQPRLSLFDTLEKYAVNMDKSIYDFNGVIWKWNKIKLTRQKAFDSLLIFEKWIPIGRLAKHFELFSSSGQYRLLRYHMEDVGKLWDRSQWIKLLTTKNVMVRNMVMDVDKTGEVGDTKYWQWWLPIFKSQNKNLQSWLLNQIIKMSGGQRNKLVAQLKLENLDSWVERINHNLKQVKSKSWWPWQKAKQDINNRLAEIYDSARATRSWVPRWRVNWQWPLARIRISGSLKNLIDQHRNKEITVTQWDGAKIIKPLLESGLFLPEYLTWRNGGDVWGDSVDKKEMMDSFPEAEMWDNWAKNFTTTELVDVYLHLPERDWRNSNKSVNVSRAVSGYLIIKKINNDDMAAILDGMEQNYRFAAGLRQNSVRLVYGSFNGLGYSTWKTDPRSQKYEHIVKSVIKYKPQVLSTLNWKKFWELLCWKDRPTNNTPEKSRCLPEGKYLFEAYSRGVAVKEDIYENLLAARGMFDQSLTGIVWKNNWNKRDFNWDGLKFYTLKTVSNIWKKFPETKPIFKEAWNFYAEELMADHDLTTRYRAAASQVPYVAGAEILFKIIAKIDNRDLKRRVYGWMSNLDKGDALASFIRVSFPDETDSGQSVAKLISKYQVDRTLLLSLVLFAPQWATVLSEAMKINGLAEAVWWLTAHTKDDRLTIGKEVRNMWTEEIGQKTEVNMARLSQGAVDVEWFFRAHKLVGAKVWDELYELAKFSSSGSGHVRAKLFADALLGNLSVKPLMEEILLHRNQDKLRALGLIPLAKGRSKQPDLEKRYEFMKQFKKDSRQFGSQRQASEKLAVEIALENLARTSEYLDPARMSWAIEGQKFDAGLMRLEHKKTTIEIQLNDNLIVETTVKVQGEVRQTIPKEIMTLDKYKEMVTLKKEIREQVVIMKKTLENAMLMGSMFSGEELKKYQVHPLLSHFINKLVWQEKISQKMTLSKFEVNSEYKISHPVDFDGTKEWEKWQKLIFKNKIVQPFKQVFRELYSISEDEKNEVTQSRRFAGHQVRQRQAAALFRNRGWTVTFEGDVYKRVSNYNLTVYVAFDNGMFSPAEVEGSTLEAIYFIDGTGKRVELDKVTPILFSEIMRDIDLVVSVAHEGGMEFETSTSTIATRATLVRETSNLLGLNNIEVQKHLVIIKGNLAEYVVHLGSGVIHKRPGSMVFVIPVHSQFRGKIFLPFADEDPKSAEVLTKVITLANDQDIKDPTILAQIATKE